jgi:transposase InsO family protein
MDLWTYQGGVTLDLSRPGKPTDNAFIEAFNGRFKAACLKTHWFLTLADAAEKLGLGVDTTMRNGYTARSATRFRSH